MGVRYNDRYQQINIRKQYFEGRASQKYENVQMEKSGNRDQLSHYCNNPGEKWWEWSETVAKVKEQSQIHEAWRQDERGQREKTPGKHIPKVLSCMVGI